ncbi:hypothetical protein ACIA49_09250 [Kribbella sp. NPDC051587]|uniref:hypothetical protein n=1 Tax=Kribbella sp. NPDC051587 TaxID=3364119 RepID=UPI0037998FA5
MDDAFKLIRQAVDLLPEDATAENGVTIEDVRDWIRYTEWEMALAVLIEIADTNPAPLTFWELLAESSRQMDLDGDRRWCEWRAWEVQHGTIRATLTLVDADQGLRQTPFAGHGELRPLWDIGNRTADGQADLDVALLWVEFAPTLGPGETASVRLAPLRPARWQHLKPGDLITMHEGRPIGGLAEVIELLPPASQLPRTAPTQ